MATFASVDIETTSIDPNNGQILSIGIIIYKDNELIPVSKMPRQEILIKSKTITGEPYAINMNSKLIERLSKGEGVSKETAIKTFQDFLNNHFKGEKITFLGKNFGSFDYPWLLANGFMEGLKYNYSFVDIGSLYFVVGEDAKVPSLEECCKRAGVVNHTPHDALADAEAVVKLFRAKDSKKTKDSQYCLFLDDIRKPTVEEMGYTGEGYLYDSIDWVIAKSVSEFKEIITELGVPAIVSLDHDLEEGHYTPRKYWHDYELSKKWQDDNIKDTFKTGVGAIRILKAFSEVLGKKPIKTYIHSQNPVGADRMFLEGKDIFNMKAHGAIGYKEAN